MAAGRSQLLFLLKRSTNICHCQKLQKSLLVNSYPRKFLSPHLSLLNQDRKYGIGDYDKLWQAVSSGRGKGRGGVKKVQAKKVDGDFLKFGKSEHAIKKSIIDPNKQTQFLRKRLQLERGWSGKTWPGRHAGPPMSQSGEAFDDFDSIVIEVKKVAATRASGRKRRTSALVVVGNGKGLIGWAIGKATFAAPAIRKAKNKAVNYLHHVPICEGKTIYHDLRTKLKSTQIIFERKVPGYGRRCQRIIRAITELAGIDNIRCKIVGRATPVTVVRVCFQGLQMQETHEDLAERTGKFVVEYRPEKGNHPIIVGHPSKEAILNRQSGEKLQTEEDISVYFDPARGAHKAKSVRQIQGGH